MCVILAYIIGTGTCTYIALMDNCLCIGGTKGGVMKLQYHLILRVQ